MSVLLKKITPFISILFFGLAVWFLEHELRQHDLGEIAQQLSDIPLTHILASLVLSFLSYVVLTGYDGLGIRFIGEKLSAGRIIRSGFISYAFSHNIGLALITGGSIRYRLYSAWGLSGLQVTQVVAFSAFTLWIGFCLIAGLSLVFATPELPSNLSIPFASLHMLGYILLFMVVIYLWGSARVNKQISIKGWSFSFPDLDIALKQVVLSSVDWVMAASVLYVLLPVSEVGFFSFTGIFLLAQIIGLFSQVPGGLGVFESVMLVYLSNFMPGTTVMGILFVYRIIYYVLPLLAAMVLLGHQEYIANRRVVKEFGQKAVNWVPAAIPHILCFLVFVSGSMLLFTGSVPDTISRTRWLHSFLPVPLIEMSHFLASLVGAGLLVLARGLQRRIDMAYIATVGLLGFGIIFSLLRGMDYIEASVLTVMLGMLIPSRKAFYRKASLLTQPLSTSWITVILVVIFSSVWLGIFLYWNTEYQNHMWWQFAFSGEAPRYLRASVALLTGGLLFGLIKMFRPGHAKPGKPQMKEIKKAGSVVKKHGAVTSNLVFSGDKELLFNNPKTAFIMYAVEGRSWISMGDPTGTETESRSLIWEFQEMCDEYDAWPVFYQAGSKYLDLYSELGLSCLKLGEEAHVSLNKPDEELISDLQIVQHHSAIQDEGYCFEVISSQNVPNCLSELRAVSEEWLLMKNNKERRFSQGYFDEKYISHFPVAVVRKEGEIVGFSNLWESRTPKEFSLDLFRYREGAPDRIADFMVTELIQWGSRQGYSRFNLGLAPLSGMEEQEVTPGWSKVAELIYTYGGNVHDFKEVRAYKSRFSPVWEPKYLVCPGGLAVAGVVSSLASVITGRFRGIIS